MYIGRIRDIVTCSP